MLMQPMTRKLHCASVAVMRLARTWNAARAQWADWPDVTLDPGDRRIRVALTWDSFPASLKQDVDAMVQAATDPWGVSSRRPIKAISAHNRAEQLRLLASAEVDAGIPAADLTSIAAVIEPARVRLGLSVIARRLKGGRTGAHINDVARHARTLAKHWARLPLDDINELKTLCRGTMPATLGMTPKNRATLRHFQGDDGEALQRRVYELPVKHYERADFAQTLKRSDLVALQTALAIELLLVTAVRSKNLAGIDINRHLVRHGRGRMARVYLVIPSEEVKNGVAVEVELPDITVVLLDQYIAHVRPGLLRAPSRWLFPGEGAGHKAAYLLSQQIADMMERTVGVRITTHQFRHFAGATYLRENPGGHEVVRRYLGHKNIETTLNFYAGMETDVAFRQLHKLVAKKRTKKS